MAKAIILMGIKHCGKSTQAALLSNFFNVPCFDTDDLIFEMTGKSPRELFTQSGEESFKTAEKNACLELKSRLEKCQTDADCKFSACVATGGGICNNPAAVEILKEFGILVFLNAQEKIAADRIVKEAKIDVEGKLFNLPAYIAKESPKNLNDVRKIFHQFYEKRQKIYGSLCDIAVEMGSAPKIENRNSIIEALS